MQKYLRRLKLQHYQEDRRISKIEESQVLSIIHFALAHAVKITIIRPRPFRRFGGNGCPG